MNQTEPKKLPNPALGRVWTPEHDEAIRQRYITDGAMKLAAEFGRTRMAVTVRAQRLGIVRRPKWSRDDDRKLRNGWGSIPIKHIAKELGRSELAIYTRAQTLGLGLGCPQGYELLSAAARRTGYATTQLRRILRWAGYKWDRAYSKPVKGVQGPRTRHIVEPCDVDDAVARWVAHWADHETITQGATRHGYTVDVLRRMIDAAIAAGDTRIPPKPARSGAHWLIPRALVDELFAPRHEALRSTETAKDAAKRVGVMPATLKIWLREAGFPYVSRERLDPKVVDEIVAARRRLETPREAARRHGRSGQFVREIVEHAANRGEIARKPERNAHWLMAPEIYDALIAKHEAGESGRRVLMARKTKKTAAAPPLARVA